MKFYELLTELTDDEVKKAERSTNSRKSANFGPMFTSDRTIIKKMKIKDDLLLRQYNLLRSNNTVGLNSDNIENALKRVVKQKSKVKVKDIDVKNNKVTLDDDREMKLTKLISKINAENDYYIVISHNPKDIAGMSTDKSWSSCTNVREGSYKKLPFEEIKVLGMVAYLMLGKTKDMNKVMNDHKKDGLFQQSAVSRISIRRFQGREYSYKLGHKEFIYLPETKCYDVVGGTGVLEKTNFLEVVKDVLDENNKETSETSIATYNRKGHKYSDTFLNRQHKYFNPKTINDLNDLEQIDIIKKYTDHTPFKYIKNPSDDVIKAALKRHQGNLFQLRKKRLKPEMLEYIAKNILKLY